MTASDAQRPRIKTDPELTRQLNAAHGSDRPVEAVLVLRPSGKNAAVPQEDAREIAQIAIERVEQAVGVSPMAVNVLANLGVVVVAAVEPFVRKLLDQPEFASAIANASDESDAAASPPAASLGRSSQTTPAKRRRRSAS